MSIAKTISVTFHEVEIQGTFKEGMTKINATLKSYVSEQDHTNNVSPFRIKGYSIPCTLDALSTKNPIQFCEEWLLANEPLLA